jgi:GR25 family glycosyltransferase involved in LPS biosynthesis
MTNTPFSFFDKIFVVNLDHRVDRWFTITNEFSRMGISESLYERFSAIKPVFDSINPQYYSKLISPERYTIVGKNEQGQLLGRLNPNYICGAIGCKMSHKEIISIAKARGYKNCLILEDDALFVGDKNFVYETLTNFFEQLKQYLSSASSGEAPSTGAAPSGAAPSGWDMLYLSGNHLRAPTVINKNLSRVNGTLTTHAYALSSDVYDVLLDGMMESGIEVDNYYWEKVQTRGKSYAVHPTIIKQSQGFSDVLNREINYDHCIS